MSADRAALAAKHLRRFRASFEANPAYRVGMNAATRGNLEEIALSRRVVDGLDWHFSHEVPVGDITAQQFAGTCWIYAGLNWLRKITMGKMKVESFLFSQNYLVFWDKLEKANRFLERMIDLRDRPLDDRRVHHYLNAPVSDGGDWLLLADLIDKYGLVPQCAMSDTTNLADSGQMNKVMCSRLRQGAAWLRRLHAEGAKVAELRKAKLELLEGVYRMLCVLLGEPPETFDVRYRTARGKYRILRDMTPRRFFEEWVGIETRDYVHLVSSPMADTPFHENYVIESLRNIEGCRAEPSLNVPIGEVRDLCVKLLKRGEAVFFDSDVTQGLNRKLGVLDNDLYEYGLLFDMDLAWPRADRMAYLHQRPTHCMVIVGVDLVDGEPAKWKIENSWGDDRGKKGIFQMSDAWFEEHVYGITVHRKDLPKKLAKAAKKEPIELPPWHTLA